MLTVNQLARSTDVLILALRNRVRLATGKEDADNTAQENQLKSNDGTVQKWIRERYSLYLPYWCKRRCAHFTCFTAAANAEVLTLLAVLGCKRVQKWIRERCSRCFAALVQAHAHTDAASGAET